MDVLATYGYSSANKHKNHEVPYYERTSCNFQTQSIVSKTLELKAAGNQYVLNIPMRIVLVAFKCMYVYSLAGYKSFLNPQNNVISKRWSIMMLLEFGNGRCIIYLRT